MSIEQVLRTDLNNSEIRYTKITYFPDRGCVHTLLTLYVYATAPLSPCNHKNINCRSHWTDQGRIERGTPTPGHLWMWKKNCTDIYCEKKYGKIWKLLKMYTWNVLFQISKYATGWGEAGTQTFASGSKYPRAATAASHSLGGPIICFIKSGHYFSSIVMRDLFLKCNHSGGNDIVVVVNASSAKTAAGVHVRLHVSKTSILRCYTLFSLRSWWNTTACSFMRFVKTGVQAYCKRSESIVVHIYCWTRIIRIFVSRLYWCGPRILFVAIRPGGG